MIAARISFFRFNSFLDTENPFLSMYLSYYNLIFQQQYKCLIYDVPGFFSALGGSMGLYLGPSVLSILFLLVVPFPKMQDVLDKKRKAGGENKDKKNRMK
jgi:hypothetical protein